jgi:hypothetical protein
MSLTHRVLQALTQPWMETLHVSSSDNESSSNCLCSTFYRLCLRCLTPAAAGLKTLASRP